MSRSVRGLAWIGKGVSADRRESERKNPLENDKNHYLL